MKGGAQERRSKLAQYLYAIFIRHRATGIASYSAIGSIKCNRQRSSPQALPELPRLHARQPPFLFRGIRTVVKTMLDTALVLLVIAALLVLVRVTQPLAIRLRLPRSDWRSARSRSSRVKRSYGAR